MITAQSAIGLALLLLSCGARASAQSVGLDVSQYVHTAWKARDGFIKGTIRSIAQTSDGYLWLGTDLGLLRFDGVKALLWQPPGGQRLPSNVIRSLLVARDGTLWIGTSQGLASWKHGQLTRHEGLAGSIVGWLLEDREGSIWLAKHFNRWTLCRFQNARVTCFGEDGGAGEGVLGLYEDRMGQLWAGRADGLWKWRPGTPMFYPLPPESNPIQSFAEAADGSLLISKAGGIRRFVDGRLVMQHAFPSSMQSVQARRLLHDRDDGLWVATSSRGLMHIHDGITDVFSQTDGLSGDGIEALFEDREGNVWVATTDGLDRFRRATVVRYSQNQGLSNNIQSVLASRDKSVWVAAVDGLNRWINGHVTVYRDRRAAIANGGGRFSSRKVHEITNSGLPAGSHSIFEDSQSRVWISTRDGIGFMANDKFVPLKGLPSGGATRAIVEDGRNFLWIANQQAGLYRVAPNGDHIEQFAWTAVQHEDPLSAMAADPSGEGVWLGFFRGGIVYFTGGRVRATYSSSGGLAEGRVSALYVDPAGVLWVAADGGLSYLKNGRLATLTSSNGLPCNAVGWVIEDDDRSLWLGMACGLVRIARADIDSWIAAAGTAGRDTDAHLIRTTLFDQADGVRTFADASYYTAPVAKAVDGKLWFMSPDGLSVVDPRRLALNSLRPPVQIEQVIADRKAYVPDTSRNDDVTLPARTRDLQIDYTALSLAAPEKVRFRYLLQGHDSDWQDAGNRRQAFYTNLSPRHYRFRVIASNNSGVWNETGAALDFAIAPAYYQTRWFLALSIVSGIALVWAAHRLRLRIVEKHQAEITALNERLMKAQEQERIRIAGELHDGVMQNMLAVTMMLGAAKRKIPEHSEAKATIDKAQQKLVQAGTEIRQLSHDLHPPLLQEAGLPKAVQAYCEQFSAATNIPLACDAAEDVRDLSRGAALALFRIVQEALGNVAKHGSARQISVRLSRTDGMVSLIVSDDGIGLDPSRFASTGGLGLVMMRERASQLNGRFEFDSAPGRGTTVRVVVPFR